MRSKILMSCGTAGGWSGSVRRLNDTGKLSESNKVIQSHSNSGANNFFYVYCPIEQIGGSWSGVAECQGGKVAMGMNIKTTIANNLLDVILVNYRRILMLFRHS
jgi:hypothetical protein